jgi:hypothetical protein
MQTFNRLCCNALSVRGKAEEKESLTELGKDIQPKSPPLSLKSTIQIPCAWHSVRYRWTGENSYMGYLDTVVLSAISDLNPHSSVF